MYTLFREHPMVMLALGGTSWTLLVALCLVGIALPGPARTKIVLGGHLLVLIAIAVLCATVLAHVRPDLFR